MTDDERTQLRRILLTPTPSELVSTIPKTQFLYSTWSAQWAEIIHAFPDASLEVGELTHGTHGVRAKVRITLCGVHRENYGYSPNPEYKNPRRKWDRVASRYIDLSDEERAINLERMVQQDDGTKAAVSDGITRCLAVWGKSLDLYWTGKDGRVWDVLYPLLTDGDTAPERPYLALADRAEKAAGTPSDAPPCPTHKRAMRFFEARNNLPAVWKCTQKLDGGSYCQEKLPYKSPPSTPEAHAGENSGAEVSSRPSDTVAKWRGQATERYADLGEKSHAQLIAGIKIGESSLTEHDIADYAKPDTLRHRRAEFLGSETLTTAEDEALRGYYAWLRSSAGGAA